MFKRALLHRKTLMQFPMFARVLAVAGFARIVRAPRVACDARVHVVNSGARVRLRRRRV